MSKTIGSLIVDLEATELTVEEAEIIAHPLVGGIILFARNYADFGQLTELNKQIRRIKGSPILITVDQEGGRVQRFKQPPFSELISMGQIGKVYADSPDRGLKLAEEAGYKMAQEVLAAGVDLSFAPILDLNHAENKVIGDRSFHRQPEAVSLLAKAFVLGMKKAGMAAVGKHFPGHGLVLVDSHLATPVDSRSLDELEQEDIQPFLQFIQRDIPALMMAHIIFTSIDQLPVSLSAYWLQNILRKKYQFTGTIFSDDLNMEGANQSASYADRVLMARDAGCDFTLVCNNRRGVIEVLDRVNHLTHQVAHDKWIRLVGRTCESVCN